MTTTAQVSFPEIDITDGTPVSLAYDDVYFSRAGGVAETRHVFLAGNGLPERFAERRHFTIAEFGFGTGLNFLVAWDAFLAHAPEDHHLHYLAVEKFPWTPTMLREAFAGHELEPLAAQLIEALPRRLPGLHRIHLPRVTLTLAFGEAAEMLAEFDTPVDAWFLDGFSPAKNPAMWSEDVLAHLGRLSAPGARVATFTAAGFVKRGLAAQGFAMEKVQGYGHKRDMLVGRFAGSPALSAQKERPSILVLGGGIAGATIARAMAERGHAVTVLERDHIASGASGNPAAVLFPQLTKQWTRSAAWSFAGYDFMLRQLDRWRRDGMSIMAESCGMLRLPRHAEEEAQLRRIQETLELDPAIVHWIDAAQAMQRTGVPLQTGGAWFRDGSWLDPAQLCRALLQHSRIRVQAPCTVTALEQTDEGWRVKTAQGDIYTAPHCCIAIAADSAALLPLTLNRVAGQVSLFPQEATLGSILCHKGYVIPRDGQWLVGATYNHEDESLTVTRTQHDENRAAVEAFLPGVLKGDATGGRTSFRATTPDRMPYIGMLAEGLWVSTGHGSRGMLSAPLGAEIIASAIAGEQAPVARNLLAAVTPARFTTKESNARRRTLRA